MRLVTLIQDDPQSTPHAVNPDRVIHCRAVAGETEPAVNIIFSDARSLRVKGTLEEVVTALTAEPGMQEIMGRAK